MSGMDLSRSDEKSRKSPLTVMEQAQLLAHLQHVQLAGSSCNSACDSSSDEELLIEENSSPARTPTLQHLPSPLLHSQQQHLVSASQTLQHLSAGSAGNIPSPISSLQTSIAHSVATNNSLQTASQSMQQSSSIHQQSLPSPSTAHLSSAAAAQQFAQQFAAAAAASKFGGYSNAYSHLPQAITSQSLTGVYDHHNAAVTSSAQLGHLTNERNSPLSAFHPAGAAVAAAAAAGHPLFAHQLQHHLPFQPQPHPHPHHHHQSSVSALTAPHHPPSFHHSISSGSSTSSSSMSTGNESALSSQYAAAAAAAYGSPSAGLGMAGGPTCAVDSALILSHLKKKKRSPQPIPDECKDSAYWERRKRNNESAKRSREMRRMKEQRNTIRMLCLEKENFELRTQLDLVNKELDRMRQMMYTKGSNAMEK